MSNECFWRPSMMWVACTPCAKHRTQHSTLCKYRCSELRAGESMVALSQTSSRCLLRNQAAGAAGQAACRAVPKQGNTHFGIMPPAMTPSATSSRVSRMPSSVNLVEMSSLSRRTPGTSVISMSFSAFSAAAICMARPLLDCQQAMQGRQTASTKAYKTSSLEAQTPTHCKASPHLASSNVSVDIQRLPSAV